MGLVVEVLTVLGVGERESRLTSLSLSLSLSFLTLFIDLVAVPKVPGGEADSRAVSPVLSLIDTVPSTTFPPSPKPSNPSPNPCSKSSLLFLPDFSKAGAIPLLRLVPLVSTPAATPCPNSGLEVLIPFLPLSILRFAGGGNDIAP